MRRYVTAVLLLFCSLDVLAAVSGIALDEKGKPLAGVRIRAFALEPTNVSSTRLLSAAPEPPALATTSTGDDGSFRLDVKREPVVTLIAEVTGYLPYSVDVADGTDAGVLPMRAGAIKKGRVLDPAGKPVAGAWVIFNGWIFLRTDEQGEYSVPDPALWAGTVLVTHPGFAPRSATRTRDAGPPLELRLESGSKVSGRVVDGAGRPVANAAIRDQRGPLARSAEDGSFTVEHLASDVKLLMATEGSRVGSAKPGAATIVVRPAAILTGSVRSAKDDRPVAGAKVVMRDPMSAPWTAITDAKGRFEFAPLPAVAGSLTIAHPLFSGGVQEVVTIEGATVDRALTATPAARISGTVIDEQKKPVSLARVGISDWGGLAFSAPDGSFSLRAFPRDRTLTVEVTKPEFAGATHGPVQVEAGEVKTGVRIVLARGKPVEIRLVDAEGVAVSNEPVVVSRRTDERRHINVPCAASRENTPCRSDNEGKLLFHVAEGEYDIRAGGETTVPRELRAQPLGADNAFTIELERGVTVEGKVVWSDGTPITTPASVYVERMQGPETLVTDGTFTMRNMRAGKQLIGVRMHLPYGFATSPIEVNAPATGVMLKVARPGRVAGKVTDRETGQPVRQFGVRREARARVFNVPPKQFASDDGRFVLEDVPSGTFDLVVEAAGYVRATSASVEVPEGETANVEVALDRAATVTGRVTAGGRAVPGASVTFDQPGVRMPEREQTDANGEFTFDSFPPGSRSLRVQKEGYVDKSVPVTAAAGKPSRVDVELSRGREVTGRVIDEAGQPVPGAGINVSAKGSGVFYGTSRVMTDAEGAFRFEGVDDGVVILTATKQGYAANRTEVGATTSSVSITLSRGGIVNGRVLGVAPADLSLVEIRAQGPGLWMPDRVTPDARGNFTITGIADGEYEINAQQSQPRRRSVRSRVKVASGIAPLVELDFGSGVSVTGRVTQLGQPVRGSIELIPELRDPTRVPVTGESLGDGSYELRVPVDGEYRVFVIPFGVYDSIAAGSVTVRGDTRHDIELRTAALRGRVVDAATGAPLANARVVLMFSGRGTSRTSDSSGRFVFESAPEGEQRVSVSLAGYEPSSRQVTVSAGVGPEIEIALARAEAVTVRVIDAATGKPVDSLLSISVDARPGMAHERLGPGTFREWLTPGSHSLRVSARGYVTKVVPVTIPPLEVVVELEVRRD